jgi:hypothetical protein
LQWRSLAQIFNSSDWLRATRSPQLTPEGELAFKHRWRVVDLFEVQVKLEAVTDGVKFHITIYGEDLTKVTLGFMVAQPYYKDKGYSKK